MEWSAGTGMGEETKYYLAGGSSPLTSKLMVSGRFDQFDTSDTKAPVYYRISDRSAVNALNF